MWEEILEKVKAFLLHDQNNRMKIKKKVVVEIKNEMLSPRFNVVPRLMELYSWFSRFLSHGLDSPEHLNKK